MAKLLVLGMGPLFEKGVRRFGGQCLRTWHFTKPLLDDGHLVRLITLPIFDPDNPRQKNTSLVRRSYEGFEYQAFTNCDFDFIHATLTDLCRSFRPDGMVAINLLPSWIAARLPVTAPLWADLNGYEMAEKQGQAARTQNDEPLLEAWRRESTVARRADKLSTVTRSQLHALLGEMAGLGRLNRLTFNYHFVHHIPNAAHPAFLLRDNSKPAEPVLRGKIVPENAFILLWSGGYNYWTNPRFLFEFVEETLQSTPEAHYVSTGGDIAGYDDVTYAEFRALAESSANRDRYHFLGWLPADEVPALYWESDLGLNIDEPNYETFFGARNRINNMMVAGLPVLTTYGSEISRQVEEAGCGVVCYEANAWDMARRVARLAGDPAECREMSRRARSYAIENFVAENLTGPLREWASEPALSPDNAEKMRNNPTALSLRRLSVNRLDAVAGVIEEADILTLEKAQIDLDAIRSKKWYSTLKGVKDDYLRYRNGVRRVWNFLRDPLAPLRRKGKQTEPQENEKRKMDAATPQVAKKKKKKKKGK